MLNNVEKCQLCQATSWNIINTIISGGWNKNANILKRNVHEFPVGYCQKCGHIQVTIPYSQEMFDVLYFANNLEPDMWCNTPMGQTSPYDEMIEYFAEYIEERINIVDFGCGAGITLNKLNQQYSNLNIDLTGVDFHQHYSSTEINYLTLDLNNFNSINTKYWPNGIDIATSSHVLEHVINPVNYLKSIANQLALNGKIFIEVPDCSSNRKPSNLAFTNLVHGQHIHYYTENSLKLFAKLAGLKAIKTRKILTGDIPRLQMLFEKSHTNPFQDSIKIQDTAASAIKDKFTQASLFRNAVYEQLISRLNNKETIGLWGIGGDFYILLKEYPELEVCIKQQRLIMFDLEHAGCNYLNQKIISSSEIPNMEYSILVIPMYGPTREKMFNISQPWSTNIIDPYAL